MTKAILEENEQLLNQWIYDLRCFDIDLDGQLYVCKFVDEYKNTGNLKLDNHFIKVDKPLYDIMRDHINVNNSDKNNQLLRDITKFLLCPTRNAKMFTVKDKDNSEHKYIFTYYYIKQTNYIVYKQYKYKLVNLKIIDLDILEEIFEGEQEALAKSNIKDNIKHELINFVTAQNVLQVLL